MLCFVISGIVLLGLQIQFSFFFFICSGLFGVAWFVAMMQYWKTGSKILFVSVVSLLIFVNDILSDFFYGKGVGSVPSLQSILIMSAIFLLLVYTFRDHLLNSRS